MYTTNPEQQLYKSSQKSDMLCSSIVSYNEALFFKKCDSRLHKKQPSPLQIPYFPSFEPYLSTSGFNSLKLIWSVRLLTQTMYQAWYRKKVERERERETRKETKTENSQTRKKKRKKKKKIKRKRKIETEREKQRETD